jgi:hypothetical protein
VAPPNQDDAFPMDDFLSELSQVVGERIEALQSSLPEAPDPVFYNDGKVIHHWPDLSGLIIEELR